MVPTGLKCELGVVSKGIICCSTLNSYSKEKQGPSMVPLRVPHLDTILLLVIHLSSQEVNCACIQLRSAQMFGPFNELLGYSPLPAKEVKCFL